MNQDQALEILFAGYSALLTGEAGSGKTYVLNKFIEQSRKHGKVVAVTATTGLAATHLNGETIHKWSKIGINKFLSPDFIKRISDKDADRIIDTDILIIDEISMLNDYQFDMINQVLKTIRRSKLPFGGIQVVLSGDFFQLPPIRKEVQADIFGKAVAGFVTSSLAFKELNPKICYLTSQFRQDDESLKNILKMIRTGDIDEYEIEQLTNRMNKKPQDETVTNLHTRNVDVDLLNQKELAKIRENEHKFLMTSSGPRQNVATLVTSVLAPAQLKLKIGASVMAIKNDPRGRYVNGSLGKVIDFDSKATGEVPIVKFNNGKTVAVEYDEWRLEDGNKVLASVRQIPLRLAYAITIHKSQGMTLDGAVIDLSKAFTPGMGYVALSRVKSLDDLYLLGLNNTALMVSEEAKELDIIFKKKSKQDWNEFKESKK